MPRFGHWVIIAANAPTAFRAKHRETLVPTLRQLQRTQPDAVLRWFDGARLWASPAEADEARRTRRTTPKRPQTWRPGGEHKDPRARFELSRDEKRARFKRRLRSGAGKPTGQAGPGGPARTPQAKAARPGRARHAPRPKRGPR